MQFLRLLTLTIALCLVPVSLTQASETVDRIVAVVYGEIITLYELDRRADYFLRRYERAEDVRKDPELMQDVRKQILESMIEDVLLKQQAEVYQIKVSDAEVDNQLRQIVKDQGLAEDEFARTLKAEKMTVEDYKDKIRMDILKHRLISGMVRRKVIVTQDEIQAYYEEHKGEYAQDKQIGLQLIVLPEDADAEDVKARIEQGEISFGQAALEYYIGPGADSNGDIDFLNWRDLAPEWRKALEGVQEGELSDVFQLQGNSALLKVSSLVPGEVKPLAELEGEIASILRKPRLEERYQEYVSDLKSKAVIDIRL